MTVQQGTRRYGLTDADLRLLEQPDSQPVIARIGTAVDPAYPRRMQHVLVVASVAIRAKRHPSNAYAEATL